MNVLQIKFDLIFTTNKSAKNKRNNKVVNLLYNHF